MRVWEALFLCTGNSARSILAEAILQRLGAGRIRAHSAGSRPSGQVHPGAIELLREKGYDPSRFRSKGWDEFDRPGAPALDFVFTVCDNAASESCPIWPGAPVSVHWGLPDPADPARAPAERRALFELVYEELYRRIDSFTRLPIASLPPATLKARLTEIGATAFFDGGED